MKRNILFFAFLLLCLSTIRGAGYNEGRRDSILQLITGASTVGQKTSILKFGAKAGGTKDCHKAFVKAMKTAKKKGGLHLVVPRGLWLVKGPIHLESNVTLELQDGATLRFDANPEYYLPAVETSWEGTYVRNYSPLIYGYGLHNVSIIGKGTIDGNCANTFATWRDMQKPAQKRSRDLNHQGAPMESRVFGEGDYLRPQLIQLYKCKDITIEDVFITNSPFWCVHLLQSENIICRGIRYDAKLVNNDGIDPESSRNILIEDVHFNNGDDNVAIKAGRDNDGWTLGKPTENIVIRNCHFKGLHAVVIGSEMSGGVKNIFIEDCDYAGYCKRGLYIKTNPDRGGFVRDIYARNLKFGEVEDLIFVTSMYAGEGMDNSHFTDIENLWLENIDCQKARNGGIILQGTEPKPLRHITLKNISIGEVPNALSMDFTEGITFQDCHFGKKAGVPTQASKRDNVFK
jgi:polygalacturonase